MLGTCKQLVAMDHYGVVSLAPTIVQYAGTTCTAVYLRGSNCWVAWSGDSRCVLGRREAGSIVAKDLTRDHKPDLEEEMARLERHGGLVTSAGKDGKPPSRVYTKGPDRHGLAMSRSIGDMGMRKAGVIPDPEVQKYDLLMRQPGGDPTAKYDAFLIVASDGVWEFIESQEACEIVDRFENAAEACEVLVREARQRWHANEKYYQDDITAVIARLPFLETELDA
uniref:PPM-type phosphatase domain-containing protein n=1 Tax=Haptolina brevifila TaxID=156173 RepID=A0A7S2J0T3_9EUKA|mmetsp:Transcript_74799/g.148665  ORF Transcript_74799/g.148665 Transcript_74799/m.148665 type:complete len:224 (+) Transcript_74799:357-1028(+)